MPASSSALCTRQHGCDESLLKSTGQRWSLIAMAAATYRSARGERAEARRPAGGAKLLGERGALGGLRGRRGNRRGHAAGARDAAGLGGRARHVVLALPAQDVDPSLVVDRVQDVVLPRPLGRRGGAAEREEVALLLDPAVRLDLEEAHAVLVLGDGDEAAVLERRVLLEPVHRAAERARDGLAVRVD